MTRTAAEINELVELHIMGAMPYSYPWYEKIDITHTYFAWLDPIEGREYHVTYNAIWHTLEDLADAYFRSDPTASGEPYESAYELVHGGGFLVDFDADSADVVIQRTAFGEVWYG